MAKHVLDAMDKGRRSVPHWNLGKKASDETKRKQSLAKIGKPSCRKGVKGGSGFTGTHTEESKEKMRIANLGKTPWNKGKKMTNEQKKNMKGQFVKGNAPWNKKDKLLPEFEINKN